MSEIGTVPICHPLSKAGKLESLQIPALESETEINVLRGFVFSRHHLSHDRAKALKCFVMLPTLPYALDDFGP